MADDKSSPKPLTPKAKFPEHPDFKDLAKEDLTAEDMDDIQRLLDQKQDVTRQDITAADFQSMLNRYTKTEKA